MIATIAEKNTSAIVAIIWKPLSSDRSDRSDRSGNDRDRLQFYLSDRSDRSDHMETTLQRSWRQQQYQDALRSRQQTTEIPYF